MSFGKPKHPLIFLTRPEHEEFHIERLEAKMNGASGFSQRCGCVISFPGRGAKLVKRCAYHEKNIEVPPDSSKEEKA